MIAFRDIGNEHRFFDIQFGPFQKDPFSILEQLYAFLGEELTDEARARMQRWRESKPVSEQGYERTDMALFGLSVEDLRERFRFYTDRFNVAVAA